MERRLHVRSAVSRPFALLLSTACLVCPVACSEPDQTAVDDELATVQVASALDGTGDVARLVKPLEATTDLGGLLEAETRAQKIADAIAAFETAASPAGCLSVETDGSTYIELTYDGCRTLLGLVTITGGLLATLEIEGDLLPTAIVFEVSSDGLTWQGPLRATTLSGAFRTRHPIAADQPVEYTGDLDFSRDDGATLSVSSDATWTVTGACVVDLDGSAHLSGSVVEHIAPVGLSATGVARCRQECPTTGAVQVAYGRGNLLAWSYTGADQAEVTGPQGKQVTVELPCASR
jgi:hypothetical protein